MPSDSIWYPFTQMKIAPPPLKVVSGKGALVKLEDGRQLIDCISSWWVNLHGHGNPKISEAIYHQALQLEHIIFAGFTHEPAERLSKMLLEILPKNLSKIFFSDNGSTAVEVALKQAYQYWKNQGISGRKAFLCFEGGYHGDTVGAMSLGGRTVFNKIFDDLLFEATYVPYPATYLDDDEVEEKEKKILALIEKELAKTPQLYAAVVIEPLVQGVNGMQMCRSEFLIQLERLVKRYNTLLIYDEVMTGFGRTGDWFACVKTGTQPDIICLAKGLTGGFMPLAVTLCTEKIFEVFYSTEMQKTFFHGHSYTANPLGCAAAIASLELLKDSPSLFKDMGFRHQKFITNLRQHPKLRNMRQCGTIVAMDFVCDQPGYLNKVGLSLRERFVEQGLLMRPLGNVIYVMPPYCITDEQLECIYSGIGKALDN